MNALRWKELLAISMIGEGTLGMVFPEEHLALWHVGPGPLKSLVRGLERRPGLTRLLAIAEACAGFALARRQFVAAAQPEGKIRRALRRRHTVGA